MSQLKLVQLFGPSYFFLAAEEKSDENDGNNFKTLLTF